MSADTEWAEAAIGAAWRLSDYTQMHVTLGGASNGDSAPSIHASVGGAMSF